MKKGPLIIYKTDVGITQAFRNIPGIDLCNVERLNLLQLAPGGHLGRMIIWTSDAFKELDSIWGTYSKLATKKNNWVLPNPCMTNADIDRIINSDEVQAALNPIKENKPLGINKKFNPLKNKKAMRKLNPFHEEHNKYLTRLASKNYKRKKNITKEVISERNKLQKLRQKSCKTYVSKLQKDLD